MTSTLWYRVATTEVKKENIASGLEAPVLSLLFTDPSLCSPKGGTLLGLWDLKFRFACLWTSYKWKQTVCHFLCLFSLLNLVIECDLSVHAGLAHFHRCLFAIVWLLHGVFTARHLGSLTVRTSVIKNCFSEYSFIHLFMLTCTYFYNFQT